MKRVKPAPGHTTHRAWLIYIAGPMRAHTARGRLANIRRAIAAGNEVMKRGHIVFVPHLSHWQNEVTPEPFAFWIGIDLLWIERCDALLRLPGPSAGADMEAHYARAIGKPVLHSIEELPLLNA